MDLTSSDLSPMKWTLALESYLSCFNYWWKYQLV